MQSPFRARNWVIFILINIVISAVTAFIVVRALTQAASRPTINQSASVVAPAPNGDGSDAVATSSALTSPLATPVAQAASSPSAAPQAQATDASVIEATAAPTTTDALVAAAATPPAGAGGADSAETNVRISTVVYPGQRSREAVVIVNEGNQVDMTGWTLSNPRGKIYTFGNVVLFKESFINLHTTTGVDVPTDLFWNQEEAVWQVGDEATLKRGDEVMATFAVK